MVTINNPFCWQSSYLTAPPFSRILPLMTVFYGRSERETLTKKCGEYRQNRFIVENEMGAEDKSKSSKCLGKITESVTLGFRQEIVCCTVISCRYSQVQGKHYYIIRKVQDKNKQFSFRVCCTDELKRQLFKTTLPKAIFDLLPNFFLKWLRWTILTDTR